MSYSKQTWANGDVITADKLNHMEEGVAEAVNGALVFHFTAVYDSEEQEWLFDSCDKTVEEVISAVGANTPVYGVCTASGSAFDEAVFTLDNISESNGTIEYIAFVYYKIFSEANGALIFTGRLGAEGDIWDIDFQSFSI